MKFTKSLWALFNAGYTKQDIMKMLFPDQDVQICRGYTKIGDTIYKQAELDQDVSK